MAFATRILTGFGGPIQFTSVALNWVGSCVDRSRRSFLPTCLRRDITNRTSARIYMLHIRVRSGLTPACVGARVRESTRPRRSINRCCQSVVSLNRFLFCPRLLSSARQFVTPPPSPPGNCRRYPRSAPFPRHARAACYSYKSRSRAERKKKKKIENDRPGCR